MRKRSRQPTASLLYSAMHEVEAKAGDFRYTGFESEPLRSRVTLRHLRDWAKAGDAFACLACYDATIARLLERSGVPVLLVGDSAAEVVLGFDRTHYMPLDVLLALTAAVRRGAPNAFLIGDMPFLSYHTSDENALKNAGRFMVESGTDAVKLEADRSFAPLVEKMTRAGIAVCAHVGSRPQLASLRGGYGSAGRTAEEAERIVEDAAALERAGAVLILVEAVPDEVTARILDRVKSPVIGIGAGSACHGQILVVNDLLGLTDTPPRFADPVADVARIVERAGAEWVRRVRARDIGGRGYRMLEGEAEKLGSNRHARAKESDGRTP